MSDDTTREQFVQQLANQIHRYDLENERLERIQGIFAVGMVKIDRLSHALRAEVQQMADHLAGITRAGLEPMPPS